MPWIFCGFASVGRRWSRLLLRNISKYLSGKCSSIFTIWGRNKK
jgi:hypothetical protein